MDNLPADQVLIYVPEISPRAEYIFEFIFETILQAEIRFTTNIEEYKQSELPRINYSTTNFSSGLFIKAHSLLFEKKLEAPALELTEYRQMPMLFASSNDSFLPFDPFAMSFYLVTRYEEYLNEDTDVHDRFNDAENILVKLGLHRKPIVDQIALWIGEKISASFPQFVCREREFKFMTTIDIDNAWAFMNKSLMVSAGGFLKALSKGKFYELYQRIGVMLGLQNDPYDTYSYILKTYKGLLDHVIFFFLVADRDQFDKSISHKNKSFRQLIADLAAICQIGIHPSYSSHQKPWMFDTEKKRMENIIQKPITQSRQHFLRLRFPNTYQTAIKAGITDDFTLGFASQAGFRAGTCTAFSFFDLSHNRKTNLTIHPFQVMDVSLKNYLQLQPEQALELIVELMNEVKQVNGTFISLWHNESLGNSRQWQGWAGVFEKILEKGLILENE